MPFSKVLNVILVAIGLALIVPTRVAGQTVVLGKSIAAEQQVSMESIDHSAWNHLLKKYVDQEGQVNYKTWKASKTDVASLDSYLATLSKASRTKGSSKQSKLAFWINAYNAVTIKGILREYPTTSIRNHTAKFFGYNIWKNLLLPVGAAPVSLDDIEHQILRKMGEPRIHFAIVCASKGCPSLLNQAYTKEKVDQQLDENAKNFFANTNNFRYDVSSQRFYLSSILSWFAEDFGKDQASQLKTIAKFLPTPEATKAATNNAVSLSFLDYDWNLNQQ